MPVVDIREMGVPVCDRLVLVHMRMRLLAIPFAVMLVLMVLIMDVGVAVFQRFMGVFMLMALGQMQPDAPSHQTACQPEARPDRLLQPDH